MSHGLGQEGSNSRGSGQFVDARRQTHMGQVKNEREAKQNTYIKADHQTYPPNSCLEWRLNLHPLLHAIALLQYRSALNLHIEQMYFLVPLNNTPRLIDPYRCVLDFLAMSGVLLGIGARLVDSNITGDPMRFR